jgi:two-component system alkaline phosphatase synthesis response regulator PhoP
MLTAKTSEADKVRGLDLGADDYIAKPFGILELTARIRTALRHSGQSSSALPPVLHFGELTIDQPRHAALLQGQDLALTLKEYELLSYLAANSSRVVPRSELLNALWGIDFLGETRTLDAHIKSLRQKLCDSSEHPRFIKTVRGVGYAFIADDDEK